jgi:hypothetical protein
MYPQSLLLKATRESLPLTIPACVTDCEVEEALG